MTGRRMAPDPFHNATSSKRVFISNGKVAWEVPTGRIAYSYAEGYYVYPPWRTIVGVLPKEIRLVQMPKQEEIPHAPDHP